MREKRLQVRTHYIHRLKYSTQERLVGAFVLLAIVLLIWLLFSSGKSLINFEEHYILYGQLETIQHVDENTEIIIGGLAAGQVQSVKITEDNHIIVVMEIQKRYNRLIRTDSIARFNAFDLGMINKSIIEISVGSPDQAILGEDRTIVISETVNIKKLLDKFLPATEELFETISHINSLLSVIDEQKIKHTIHKINALADAIEPQQIKELLNNLQIISADAGELIKNINVGGGVPVTISSVDTLVAEIDFDKLDQTASSINQLLAAINPQSVNAIIENFYNTAVYLQDISQQIKDGKGIVGGALYNKQIKGDFEKTLNNLSKATHQLDRLLILLNKEIENMPGLLNKIEPLIDEVDKTIKATQKVWPISSTIEKNGRKKILISPEPIND